MSKIRQFDVSITGSDAVMKALGSEWVLPWYSTSCESDAVEKACMSELRCIIVYRYIFYTYNLYAYTHIYMCIYIYIYISYAYVLARHPGVLPLS